MRQAPAIVGLVAVVIVGTLLVAPHGKDAPPLLEILSDDMTLVTADRVDGSPSALPQLIVTWGRTDPDQGNDIVEEGLSVYDEHPAGERYRRTFLLDPPDQAKQERHRIGHRTYDLDGDGHAEILAVEDLDGSALTFVYHLIAHSRGHMRDLYRKKLSFDDGLVRVENDALVTYEGVVREPGEHGIHCCWSQYRKTVRKLRQGRLVIVERSRTKHRPADDQRS